MNDIYKKIPFAKESYAKVESNLEYINTISNLVDSVLYSINRAIEQNKTSTCFAIGYDYYDDVKKLFIAKGYTFKPTGMCGGVWQDSEDICW